MEYTKNQSGFNPEDILGQRYGLITVMRFLRREPYRSRYNYYYECRCACGTVREFCRVNLVTWHTISCGCLKTRRGKNSPCWGGHEGISGRLWGHIKAHAKNRGLSFTVTIQQAWELFVAQGGKCALSGVELSLRASSSGAPNAESASLDRIDNTRGYEPRNIQWLHKDVNWMKGRFTQDRFIEICRAVVALQGSGK